MGLSPRTTWLQKAGVALALLLGLGDALAAPDVKLPPGTRTVDGQLVSGRGLRDTTEIIARDLAQRGILARQIGPYRWRGVELTRFVSDGKSTDWLAIHVVRIAGKTMISFVPRPSPLDVAPASR
ncbi:MAG: hypothetical protein NT062_08560 [Proteobacteria bacterium]|nr:hypothetical protein [Pseudomonadota bacterium]